MIHTFNTTPAPITSHATGHAISYFAARGILKLSGKLYNYNDAIMKNYLASLCACK